MKKYRFMAGLMCFVLSSTVFIGCGKGKIPEAATINNETTDIYATQGEVEEKKDEELEEEIPVDTRALLKDAMRGITAVRMTTTVNVDALPTSILSNDEEIGSSLPTNEGVIVLDDIDTADVSEPEKVDDETDTIPDETMEEVTNTETTSDKEIENEEPTDITDKEVKYDKNHSALDMSSKGKQSNSDRAKTTSDNKVMEETPATDVENSGETEGETAQVPTFVPTDESTYYINLKVSTDMDTTKAKNYGRLRMNLGAVIDKEEASYVDYSVEPATGYIIKHSIETGADTEGNSTEEVASKWYKTNSDFYGIATIKEVLENADIVSYNESIDSHIIGIIVDKNLAEKLDITNDIMSVLFEGKNTVFMTCYLSKADGILTRIVITIEDFEGTQLSQVEVQTNNYVITFEKYNSINKVMIPDTILDGALEITGEENFISDTDLVKYNFEKIDVEQELEPTIEQEKLKQQNTDDEGAEVTYEEDSVEEKQEEDSVDTAQEKDSVDVALKATQSNKK